MAKKTTVSEYTRMFEPQMFQPIDDSEVVKGGLVVVDSDTWHRLRADHARLHKAISDAESCLDFVGEEHVNAARTILSAALEHHGR